MSNLAVRLVFRNVNTTEIKDSRFSEISVTLYFHLKQVLWLFKIMDVGLSDCSKLSAKGFTDKLSRHFVRDAQALVLIVVKNSDQRSSLFHVNKTPDGTDSIRLGVRDAGFEGFLHPISTIHA